MKTITIEGKTYNGIADIPDPLKLSIGTISPVTEKSLLRYGATIEDDGQPTPKERVCNSFKDLIEELATMTDKITPEEFLSAAQNGISADLIDFAHERKVPEEVIEYGRKRIAEILMDATRFNMTWTELIAGATASE